MIFSWRNFNKLSYIIFIGRLNWKKCYLHGRKINALEILFLDMYVIAKLRCCYGCYKRLLMVVTAVRKRLPMYVSVAQSSKQAPFMQL